MSNEEENVLTASQVISKMIEERLNQWLQEFGGGFVTAFTACVEYVDSDGDHCWASAEPPGQTPSQTMGLLRWHTMASEARVNAYMTAMVEDE